MAIAEIRRLDTAAPGSSPSRTQALGKDEFFKLLIAQLKYQNPLEPVKNTEFLGQMAQISSVEQLFGINAALKDLRGQQGALANAQAVALIGKEVRARGDGITLGAAGSLALGYELPKDSAKVTVQVYNAAGQPVKILEAGAQKAGAQSLTWDGTNAAGARLPAGEYTFVVNAIGPDGAPLATQTYFTGTITGVAFADGKPVLLSGTRRIPLDQLIEVKAPAAN
ncbi:MAG: hypothetical protein HYY85_01550 [Deltaproteobacteria bacterium]|nr:hypothetical protein [Deltaproteobacteria bacterium]